MKQRRVFGGLLLIAIAWAIFPVADTAAEDIARPEEIRSLREVIYDQATYSKLAEQWQTYYRKFPSEYAYANWMYAARYARQQDYQRLLDKGLKKYPSNPKLLYLSACHAGSRDVEDRNRERLERSVALDPGYADPWFSLVTAYMALEDEERTNVALRRVQESGVITDWIMDFCHNSLVGLDSNAILVTNGDNDTYPNWVLTRLLNVRPDVVIVNRSLLNTDWYPDYTIRHGAPHFITPSELTALRTAITADLKRGKATVSLDSPFGDTLIVRLVEAAQREGRPVYFAATLSQSPTLKRLSAEGRPLGLATLVTPSSESHDRQWQEYFAIWLSSFRTGGIDSWQLHVAPKSDAGRFLMVNYGPAIVNGLEALRRTAPDLRAKLFDWYGQHVEWVLSDEMKSGLGQEWCKHSDVPEIRSWCEKRG